MIIQMVYQMSGGRYDDRQWAPPGVDFEVPDEEGDGLVRAAAAIFVRASAPAPSPPASATPAPVSEPSATAAGPVAGEGAYGIPQSLAATGPEAGPVPEEAPEPKPADPKAVWVDYAVSQGAGRSDAESLTKAQLMQAYGGRL